jgi:hypothetical protein
MWCFRLPQCRKMDILRQALKQMNNYVLEPLKVAAEKIIS